MDGDWTTAAVVVGVRVVTGTGGSDEGGMTQPADGQVQNEVSLVNALE